VKRVTIIVTIWAVLGLVQASTAQTQQTTADQDAFARAKRLYASANFEDALQILESLKNPATSAEVSAYQVYCLFALGRLADARVVVERIVRADPLFRPPDGQVAPRVRAFFDEARKPVLLDVARQSFKQARASFEARDMAGAAAEFDRVIAVIDEIGGADSSVTDFRTVAVAFRDLARMPAQTPTPTPSPAVPGRTQKTPVPASNTIAPVALSAPLPEWHPNIFELNRTFSGQIELLIDEQGKVLSASILTSVHPRYDDTLLEAAKDWTFKPATKNGVAIPYRYVMNVQVLR
jgi:TonB family protein